LTKAGEQVVEVNRPNRLARRMDGKSDRLDAEQIARAARLVGPRRAVRLLGRLRHLSSPSSACAITSRPVTTLTVAPPNKLFLISSGHVPIVGIGLDRRLIRHG